MFAVGGLMCLNARVRIYGFQPSGYLAMSPGWPIPFYDRGGAFGHDINPIYILLDSACWMICLGIFIFLVEALARSKSNLRTLDLSVVLGLLFILCLYPQPGITTDLRRLASGDPVADAHNAMVRGQLQYLGAGPRNFAYGIDWQIQPKLKILPMLATPNYFESAEHLNMYGTACSYIERYNKTLFQSQKQTAN